VRMVRGLTLGQELSSIQLEPRHGGLPSHSSRETVTVLLYTNIKLKRLRCGARALFRSLRQQFDPLDCEILERAFDAAWSAVKGHDLPIDFESDEGLEAILRRELIEIACFNGVSDPESLRDILLTRLPQPDQR
jgi:hypothetical protein